MQILWRSGIEVGDTAFVRGKRWIIFGIRENYQVERKQLKGTLDLTLGRYVDPSVSLRQTNVSQGANNQLSVISNQ